MLSLELEQQADNSKNISALKYKIYLNQSLLNQEGLGRKTPLSYCKNSDLRKLMVVLGANPSYLNQDVPEDEQTTLKALSASSKKNTHQLQIIILKAYIQHSNDRAAFSAAVNSGLGERFVDFKVSSEITDFAFNELHSARNEAELLGALERIVNFIKWIFSADILSQASRLESRKLLFYKEKSDSDSESENPDNETRGPTA